MGLVDGNQNRDNSINGEQESRQLQQWYILTVHYTIANVFVYMHCI